MPISSTPKNIVEKFDLTRIHHVHCLGIGGIGLSAIARMMRAQGKVVSGTDVGDSEITRALEKLGIHISIGDSTNVPPDADLVVYTVAIPATNADLVAARERGVPVLTYPEMLSVVSRDTFTIAVAGTHGKTTTTAMVARILIDAGLEPTVIVGSLLKGLDAHDPNANTNCVIGAGKYFVVEACEYRRSFLNLHPRIAVITNVDADHLDYYKNIEGVQEGFHEFADRIDGTLVCNLSQPYLARVVAGLSPARVVIEDYGTITSGTIPRLKIPGAHNIENATAALAVARLLGIPDEQSLKSLAAFRGTWRRFEYLGTTPRGVLVYDDYAHHPTEIRATLAGAREMFLDKKIVVVFQPHLYSRTKEHLDEFAHAFSDADEVIVAPIYAAREPHDPTISSALLAEKLRATHLTAFAPADTTAVETHVLARLQSLSEGDVIMTMGAGDINNLGAQLKTPVNQ